MLHKTLLHLSSSSHLHLNRFKISHSPRMVRHGIVGAGNMGLCLDFFYDWKRFFRPLWVQSDSN